MVSTTQTTTCTRCTWPVYQDDSDWTHAFDQTATCHGDPVEPRTT